MYTIELYCFHFISIILYSFQMQYHMTMQIVWIFEKGNTGPLFAKAVRRLTTRSCEFSKPQDMGFDFSNPSEIWQASRQQCCEMPVKFQRDTIIISVHENHWTHRTFPMARPKHLMKDFTNLNRLYKAHWTNVWWILKVFRVHCIIAPKLVALSLHENWW